MLKRLSIAAAGATIATLTTIYSASAATFRFSFSNENGAVNGIVEGTIELPNGDGTFAATSVIVTSTPALGYTLPLDIFTDINNPINNINTFTVVGGVIDTSVSSFIYANFTEGLALNLLDLGFSGLSFLNLPGTATQTSGVADFDGSTVVFSSATVPEPTTLLGLLTVGSLGALTRKRKA